MALVDLLLGTRPAALWPLHEASGTFRDRSGNGRDSTSVSSPVYQHYGVVPADQYGARLSGTQFVEFPAATADFGPGQALSLGGWFHLNATGSGAQHFFGKATSATRLVSLYVDAAGTVVLTCENANGLDEYFFTATGALTTAMQRRHIIVTLGSDNVARIYLDAVLQTCTYQIAPSYASVVGTSHAMNQRIDTGTFRLGKNASGSAPDVSYGMCGVWQAELNAQQIAEHYQWGLGIQPTLLGRRRLRAGSR